MTGPGKRCEWCETVIPLGAHPRSKFCSKPCRQAAHRFHRRAERSRRASTAMTFGYADPPYPGKAHYYEGHPDYAGEVDHELLVADLVAHYPDGWALSTSAAALRDVLAVVPSHVDVRVASWHRRWRPNPAALWPLSAWEPVIYAGGRPRRRDAKSEGAAARLDALTCLSGPLLTDPARVIGQKPGEFAYWLFDLLGALPGDDLVDMFPGSGGIGRAWARFQALEPAPSLFDEVGA
jgi:hypothetical protein